MRATPTPAALDRDARIVGTRVRVAMPAIDATLRGNRLRRVAPAARQGSRMMNVLQRPVSRDPNHVAGATTAAKSRRWRPRAVTRWKRLRPCARRLQRIMDEIESRSTWTKV
jgi:hypothetical protein